MASPLTIQFDGSSPAEDRTINFGNQSAFLANEYNVSVVDQNGESVTGSVQGTVSADFYFPGSDRPQTTASTIDLSSGCRRFNLFFATVNRAVFSVNNLAANQQIQVYAIRGRV